MGRDVPFITFIQFIEDTLFSSKDFVGSGLKWSWIRRARRAELSSICVCLPSQFPLAEERDQAGDYSEQGRVDHSEAGQAMIM